MSYPIPSVSVEDGLYREDPENDWGMEYRRRGQIPKIPKVVNWQTPKFIKHFWEYILGDKYESSLK